MIPTNDDETERFMWRDHRRHAEEPSGAWVSAICLLLVLLLIAGIVLRAALARANPPGWRDLAELPKDAGDEYRVCFTPGEAGADLVVQLRRVRVEGGAPEELSPIPRSEWTAASDGRSCVTDRIPRSGHFRIDLRHCWSSGEQRCSDWVSSTDPTHARVAGQPRGWLLYAFPAAPGQPVPIPFP